LKRRKEDDHDGDLRKPIAIKTGIPYAALAPQRYKTALCKSGCDAHKTFETETNGPIGFSSEHDPKNAKTFGNFRWGGKVTVRASGTKVRKNVKLQS